MGQTQEWPTEGASSWSADQTKDGRISLGDIVLVRARVEAILENGTIAVQARSQTEPDTAWHYVKENHVLTIPEARASFGMKNEVARSLPPR